MSAAINLRVLLNARVYAWDFADCAGAVHERGCRQYHLRWSL